MQQQHCWSVCVSCFAVKNVVSVNFDGFVFCHIMICLMIFTSNCHSVTVVTLCIARCRACCQTFFVAFVTLSTILFVDGAGVLLGFAGRRANKRNGRSLKRTPDMGRKREFDHARALERATRLFWARGYGPTPVRDLLKAMGIRESSFYYLFGSKRRLYLACMKHYNETVTMERLAAITAEPSARKGIREFFKRRLDELDDSKTPRVCLMARSLSSDVMEERLLQPYVKTEMAMFEQCIVKRLKEAKSAGELPADFQAELTARIIFTYLQGYFRVVQVLKPREEIWEEIEALLTSLGL